MPGNGDHHIDGIVNWNQVDDAISFTLEQSEETFRSASNQTYHTNQKNMQSFDNFQNYKAFGNNKKGAILA